MNSIGTKVLVGLLVVFIIIQFFGIDKSVPETDSTKDLINIHEEPTSQTAILIKGACYDCHSYETEYPWYANIAPVSWWLKGHIDEARDEMNFSLWADYAADDANHMLEEAIELVEDEEMPLPQYTWMHAQAQLSDEQKQELTDWFSNIRSEIQQEQDTN